MIIIYLSAKSICIVYKILRIIFSNYQTLEAFHPYWRKLKIILYKNLKKQFCNETEKYNEIFK
ncbi:hypothetical protein ALC56_03676 [Trachymyrmex septentrionalis]|uniref:Uncharacterized protein n=1 Tax=Trachymyrmex septentrionalis TaxID=34720 RepID=A0A151JZ83_9HYME|nr:hypothetical protein ALC56_03676 [Trachymyrmex septentrionalis]